MERSQKMVQSRSIQYRSKNLFKCSTPPSGTSLLIPVLITIQKLLHSLTTHYSIDISFYRFLDQLALLQINKMQHARSLKSIYHERIEFLDKSLRSESQNIVHVVYIYESCGKINSRFPIFR